MIFTRDFVTRENYWQIASLVTQKSLFMVTHVLFFMSLQMVLLLESHYLKIYQCGLNIKLYFQLGAGFRLYQFHITEYNPFE